jgi:hypothetical protein
MSNGDGDMYRCCCWGVATEPRTNLWCPSNALTDICMMCVDDGIDVMNTCNDLITFATRQSRSP